MQRLTGRKEPITSLAFAPDLPYLAAVGEDSHDGIDLWNTDTGQHERNLPLYDDRYNCPMPLAFLPNGELIVTHNNGWTVFDVRTPHAEIFEHQIPGLVTTAISPDGQYVLAGSANTPTYRLYRRTAKSTTIVWDLPPKGERKFVSAIILADGTIVALEYGGRWQRNKSLELVKRSLKTGELLASWPCPLSQLLGLSVAANGTLAASVTTRTLFVWDLEQPATAPRKFGNLGKRHLRGLALAPDGDKVATLSNDHYVRMVEPQTGELQATFAWNIGPQYAIQFSPDGLRVAVGGRRGEIVVWDVE